MRFQLHNEMYVNYTNRHHALLDYVHARRVALNLFQDS